MVKARIDWVDVLKGFAMLMVMIGHTYVANGIQLFVYSFHVPLFFIMSGYVFSIKENETFKSFFIKKVRTLLIPNYCFCMIVSIIQSIMNKDPMVIVKRIMGLFIELRGTDYSTLWFIICLFVAEILYWFILKLSKGNFKFECTCLIVCSVGGYLYMILIDHIVPWCLDTALIAVGFIGIGRLARSKSEELSYLVNLKWLFICLAIFSASSVLNWKFGECPDLYADNMGLYPFYYISAMSGSLSAMIFFRMIPTVKTIRYIGQNSFVFYAFHEWLYSIFDKYVVCDTTVMGVLYVLASSILCAFGAYLVNRYAPWMLGRNSKNEI